MNIYRRSQYFALTLYRHKFKISHQVFFKMATIIRISKDVNVAHELYSLAFLSPCIFTYVLAKWTVFNTPFQIL
jgi:hypothetical protein